MRTTRTLLNNLFWASFLGSLLFFTAMLFIPPVKPFLIYTILFGFSFLLILLTAWSIQAAIAKWMPDEQARSRKIHLPQIIAATITVAIFIEVINTVIRAIMIVFFRFSIGLPNNFIRVWEESKSFCEPYLSDGRQFSGLLLEQDLRSHFFVLSFFFSSDCFSQIFSGVLNIWTLTLGEAFSIAQIFELPFGGIILAFVIWLLLSKGFDSLSSTGEDANVSNNDLWSGWIYNLSSELIRSNILFFLLLGFGIYLSIASIAAIPSLETTVAIPISVNADALNKKVDDIVADFKRGFQVDSNRPEVNQFQLFQAANPFKNIETMIQADQSRNQPLGNNAEAASGEVNPSEPPLNATPNSSPSLSNQAVNQVIVDHKRKRMEIIDSGERMLGDFSRDIEDKASIAKTQYLVSAATRIGQRETTDHFLLLTQWFQEYSDVRERQINDCLSQIRSYDGELTRWSDRAASELGLSSEESRFAISNTASLDPYWLSASSVCNSVTVVNVGPMPNRREFGSYLGPFRFISSWLIRTESLPLALITGLIGFGLLGSACSSFIRERLDPAIDSKVSSLVQDLPKVVVIGVSAAILAFLAVMGGLAAFFSSGSDPNPYALLLGCLVAAVFGEDVWQWAHEKLHDNLSNSANHSAQVPRDLNPPLDNLDPPNDPRP